MKEKITFYGIIYNEIKNIRRFIDNIKSFNHNLFLVDGFSIDGTVDVLKEYEVPFIQNEIKNFGQQFNLSLQSAIEYYGLNDDSYMFLIGCDEYLNHNLNKNLIKCLSNQTSDIINVHQKHYIDGKIVNENIQPRIHKSKIKISDGINHNLPKRNSHTTIYNIDSSLGFLIHDKTNEEAIESTRRGFFLRKENYDEIPLCCRGMKKFNLKGLDVDIHNDYIIPIRNNKNYLFED